LSTKTKLFRQTPTLYRTWRAAVSSRKFPREANATPKILGAVSVPPVILSAAPIEYFNAETYLSFVDEELLPHYYRRGHRVYLIQDNASFHKKPEVLSSLPNTAAHRGVFVAPTRRTSMQRSDSGITPERRAPQPLL